MDWRRNQVLEPLRAILERRRWLAVTAFLIPLAGAVVLATALPDLYRSTATILVQRGDAPVAAPAAIPAVDVDTRLQVIREEILSRQRLDAMVERLGLYPELRGRAPKELIVGRMRKDIQIQLKGSEMGAAPPGTIAFSLTFRGTDRAVTAEVANALAESYVQENLTIRGRQAKGTADMLQAQLSEVRARLDEQELHIGQYQAAHTGELSQQLVVNLSRMHQLETQLQLNRDSRLRVMERREGVDVADPRYADVSGSPEAASARLARLKAELVGLQAIYSEKYPEVVRLKSEIAALENAQPEVSLASSAAPSPPAPARNDLRRLEEEEDRLRAEINTYRGRVDRAPLREQEFAQLSRDYSTTKELYDSLLKRYQEARIADDLERGMPGGQLRILDAATTPIDPYAPNKGLMMLFALAASLAFAVGVVAIAERLDTSFHTVDDLRAFTKVPVLLSIPLLSTRVDRARKRRRFAGKALLTVVGIAMVGAVAWLFAHGNIDLVQLLARGGAS